MSDSAVMFDAEKVKSDIVDWIRDWFDENGKGCMAVVGFPEERTALSWRHYVWRLLEKTKS